MSNVQKKVVVDKMHPFPPQNIPASSFCRQYQDLTSQLDFFVSFPWNTDLTNIRIRIRCKFGKPSIHESLKTWEMSVLRNGLYELCQLQELVLENMVKIVRLVKLVNLTKLANLMKLATLVKLSNLMRLVKLSNLVGFHFSQFQICTLMTPFSVHCFIFSASPLSMPMYTSMDPTVNHVLHPPRQAVFCICLLTQLIKQIPKKPKTEIGLGDQLEASALCYNFMLFSCH